MISHAAHLRLKARLAQDVEGFIRDALQEWAAAAEGAVNDAKDPGEEDSVLYWIISLAGNMLWAATVFFPPAAAVGAVTRAVKIASTLGAALGSDVVRRASQYKPDSQSGKKFLRDMLATKQDNLRAVFINNADAWIQSDLHEFVTQEMLAAAGDRHLVDDDVDNISVLSQDKLRNYTLEHFIFPGASFTGSNFAHGMRQHMLRQLTAALISFNKQFKAWDDDRNDFYWSRRLPGTGIMLVIKDAEAEKHWSPERKAQVAKLRKEPRILYDTLGKMWSDALYELDHPFMPVVRFSALPHAIPVADSSAWYPTAVGDAVVKWKYPQ